MAEKQNCWEFKGCGREVGGSKAQELGVCPATIATQADGIHGGSNGGRACWAIAGTLCGGSVQGTFAAKMGNCLRCSFYQHVAHDEGSRLVSPTRLEALIG